MSSPQLCFTVKVHCRQNWFELLRRRVWRVRTMFLFLFPGRTRKPSTHVSMPFARFRSRSILARNAYWRAMADACLAKSGPVLTFRLCANRFQVAKCLPSGFSTRLAPSLDCSLLSPLFVVVALLIKLDSSGPIFFMQRRYGFNQQVFHIFKFRSMTTMEDGAVLSRREGTMPASHASAAGLRRCNIDELPQLLNVLRGDMSLVGRARTPLLMMNLSSGRSRSMLADIMSSPVLPVGAQVNGFRGEIKTGDDIRGRVRHDLHYARQLVFLVRPADTPG